MVAPGHQASPKSIGRVPDRVRGTGLGLKSNQALNCGGCVPGVPGAWCTKQGEIEGHKLENWCRKYFQKSIELAWESLIVSFSSSIYYLYVELSGFR